MRHPRSAALLTATALAGLSLTLAFAPSAAADIPTPTLGQLGYSPSTPQAQGPLTVTGDGCLGLPVISPSSAGASGAKAAAPALDDPITTTASVAVTIDGPSDFTTSASVTPGLDGSWSTANSSSVITLGDAGDYTIEATCTLIESTQTGGGDGDTGGGDQGVAPAAAQDQLSTPYDSVSFTVAPPPTTVDPAVNCSGCDSVKPGGNITVSGTGFPVSTAATVNLAGYTAQSSKVDADGALSPVTFVIRADQAAGTVSGTVVAGGASQPFSVTVVLPQAPGGNVDGDVPGDNGGGDTDSGSGDTDTTPVDVSYTSSAPTLPNTGTDSLWQGVLGGALLLSGGGLVFLGRRRTAGSTAA